MDRPIVQHEAGVVRWLLDHATIGDGVVYRAAPVEQLRVVHGCECGCASLYFETKQSGGRARIIADALAVYADGQQAGLILWGRDGRIVWLEIYDCDLGASHRFPEIDNLRTWEQHGRDLG